MADSAQYQYIPNRIVGPTGLAPGANIYFYLTGTTTLATVYSDADLTTPLANPCPVNAGAQVPSVYYDSGIVLRVRVVSVTGVVISDDDPWMGFTSSALSFLQSGTGAVPETVQTALRRTLSIRQFCAGNSVADDTAGVRNAIAEAISSGSALDGHGGIFRLTGTVNLVSYLIMRNATFLIDHPGAAFSRDKTHDADPGYHGVARMFIENVTLKAYQNASIGWDCDQFQYNTFINCRVMSNSGSEKFGIGFKYYNVAYWNHEIGTEIEAATVGWDLNDHNDGRYFSCKLVRFAAIGVTHVVRFSGGCSGVQFFGMSCETTFNSAIGIEFHADCEAILIAGVRIEARTGSTSFLPIKFNGCQGNTIIGAYTLGAGITNYTDTIGDNDVQYYTTGGWQRHMGAGVLSVPYAAVNPDTAKQLTYHTGDNAYKGYDGSGVGTFMMTVARAQLDMNGFPATNVASLRLQKNSASVGTDPNTAIMRNNSGLFIDFENGVSRKLRSNSAAATVTGSRGGNAALASLLTALVAEGVIVDGTTA